jgi:hypothetical protein
MTRVWHKDIQRCMMRQAADVTSQQLLCLGINRCFGDAWYHARSEHLNPYLRAFESEAPLRKG